MADDRLMTLKQEFAESVARLVGVYRDNGLSDEAIAVELQDAASALIEGLS